MTTIGHPGVYGEGDKSLLGIVAGGTAIEWICGIAAVVLGILGLFGLLPQFLLSVAVIVVGAALLADGGAVMGRFASLIVKRDVPPETAGAQPPVAYSGGVTAEFYAGIAGIVLGILAVIGLYPLLMCTVAVLVFGAAVALGGLAKQRASEVALAGTGGELASTNIAREGVAVASGAQLLVGIAAVVLGIMAMLNYIPLRLCLAAMIVLGGALFFSGASVNAKVAKAFVHRRHTPGYRRYERGRETGPETR